MPRFLAAPPQETTALTENLERMRSRAREIGWRASVADLHDPAYISAEERTRYVGLLPLGPTTRVLEVGCSLGQGTSALARAAGRVDAVEVVPGQAAFAAERLRQEGLTNVSVCAAGDDCLLPFGAGRFDVAVLNLVLEWCGQRGQTSAHRSQRQMLAEVARTLLPGGLVFVATKNRFGAQYLTGGPDEHVGGLRFGNALPRAALALVMRARGPVEPRGTLHSYPALRGMLAAAGFEDLRGYWAAPDARYPSAYIPVDADSVRAAQASLPPHELGGSRRVRLVMRHLPAPLVKFFAPGLVFTGVRRAA